MRDGKLKTPAKSTPAAGPTEDGSERNGGSAADSQREQTDESLRVERVKADLGAEEKQQAQDEIEDEVVRVARHRADEVVQEARDAADVVVRTAAAREGSDRERIRADILLESERSSADAGLEDERALRRRYLGDFLLAEREATDQDLGGERAHADTLIASRDEFLGIVSHDLRGLLHGLSLNQQLLVKHAHVGPEGDQIRKFAESSQRVIARMNRLVNDLLDLASIDAGKLAVVTDDVDVGTILRDTLDAFAPIAATKRIALDGAAGGQQPNARLDAERILQVLANLVSNAIKFTPVDGHVSIQIESTQDETRFAVSDTGIGIPADATQVVFERYRQVSADRHGLGLGLYISKCIVEAHGGRMWVDSRLGQGSTFHFAVPSDRIGDVTRGAAHRQ